MTAKEALENIINEHNHLLEKYKINGGLGNWYLTVKKALNRLEELEKKEIATNVVLYDEIAHCPRCGYQVFSDSDIYYCTCCGQRLDWSDEK